METIKNFVKVKKQRVAKRILNELITKKETLSKCDMDKKYHQIADLGFPHVVLALKAEEYEIWSVGKKLGDAS